MSDAINGLEALGEKWSKIQQDLEASLKRVSAKSKNI